MTTAQKLWLSFGTLVALLLLTTLTTICQLIGLQGNLRRIATVQEPTSAATYEMEKKVTSAGMEVMHYLYTRNPKHRDQAAMCAQDFAQAKAQFDGLADSPRSQELGRQVAALFQEYQTLGETIMEQSDQEHARRAAIGRRATAIQEILDKKILARMERDEADWLHKVEEAAAMGNAVADMMLWLGNGWNADADSRDRIADHLRAAQQRLDNFKKLRLTAEQKQLTADLEEHFNHILPLVKELAALHDRERENIAKFVALRMQLDDLLDAHIQKTTHRELSAAQASAHQSIKTILATIVIMLLTGLFLGVVMATGVGQWIIRSEEVVRAERERLQVTLASIGDGVIATDDSGRVTFLNPAAQSLTGWRPGDAAGQPLSAVFTRVHEQTRDPVPNLVPDSARTAMNHTLLIAKDGTERPIEETRSPIRDARGQFSGMALVFRDITERKQAEERIRKSEERFRRLANTVPSCVWTANPDGLVNYANERWYAYSGLSPEKTAGFDWMEAVHPEDRERCLATYQQALHEGAFYEIEVRNRGADGKYRWFLTRALPVRDPQGAITGWFGTSTDINEQKTMQETLQDADRRKDEFLAVLSHELRNPLAPIRNALHILRLNDESNPEIREAREIIERQVQILSGIVDDLLDVFRIIHNKIALRKGALDLVALARQTAADHRGGLENTGLILRLELPEAPVWVLADKTRLAQVLTNLLHNAAKFSNPAGQVTVRVQADAAGQRASVAVRDTGIGIAPEVLPHVFETFIQGNQSLDRIRGGLGLGLALVKGLIELHGGGVEATSDGPGRGSEFSFWLPLAAEPAPSATAPVWMVPSVKALRILIVEDNRDTAMTLRKILTRYGHEVAVAYAGPAGLAAARQQRPDVVLCDLGLPEMDGYEVAKTLRQDPATAGIRLIAVSGYGQDEDRRRSEEAGFDLHLTKPVDPVELQRLLSVLKVGRS